MTRSCDLALLGRGRLRRTGSARPTSPGDLGQGTPAPFTFHGHRLASLYRADRTPRNPFIFLKIRTAEASVAGAAMAYLVKDEKGGVRA
jgi:hypothetical protein